MMIRTKSVLVTAALAASVIFASTAHAQVLGPPVPLQLITNGGFEENSAQGSGPGGQVANGRVTVTGWTMGSENNGGYTFLFTSAGAAGATVYGNGGPFSL